MKTLTISLLAVVFVESSGYLIKVPEIQTPVKTASLGWIHIQKLLLPLFENVCEESTNPTIVRLAQQFSLDAVSENYMNPEVIGNLKKLYGSNNQLPKGEIFTELNQIHMYELKVLYDGLYWAQNFDTFYKVAAWARQNVNCGLFVNAIYLATLKRHDTEKVTVPAPYELLPNYFIRRDVIVKASSLLAGGDLTTEDVLNEGNGYTLNANYTSTMNAVSEYKLAYFHEDIGLNSYYLLRRLQSMHWLQNIEDVNSKHGEYVYHFIKNLVARYNMERYSNGLLLLDRIDWNSINVDPYDPILVFSNGEQFSERQNVLDVNNPMYTTMQNIEDNIISVITPMVQEGYNKSQIINNLMGILVTNLENYDSLARSFFSDGLAADNRWRSVLAHHMTSLRDPLSWKINKKIVDIVGGVLKTLPWYQRNELYFPGVQIQNVEVKKITTMFEPFQFDVTNALKSTENPSFRVNIVQSRLNHKPFTIKLNITSLITQKGLVKLYLGPKVLPGEFAMKKDLFMQLDSFEINLKLGSNIISRTSDAIENISVDFTSINVIRKLVEDAEFGLDVQPFQSVEVLTGFPSRLVLPKGTAEGLPMQLLAFIAPFAKVTAGGINVVPKTEFNTAVLSPGYPFDLAFDDKQFFALPNVIVKDIIVTHKDASGYSKGYNGPKKWNGDAKLGTYGPSREPFDYNLKKSQYGKSGYYADKTGAYNTISGVAINPMPNIENQKLENKENLNPNYITDYLEKPEISLNDDYHNLQTVKQRLLNRNENNYTDYIYE